MDWLEANASAVRSSFQRTQKLAKRAFELKVLRISVSIRVKPDVRCICLGCPSTPANAPDLSIERGVVGMALYPAAIGFIRELMLGGGRAFGMMMRSLAGECRRRCHTHHDHDRDQRSHVNPYFTRRFSARPSGAIKSITSSVIEKRISSTHWRQKSVRHGQRATLVGLQRNFLCQHDIACDEVTFGRKAPTNTRTAGAVELVNVHRGAVAYPVSLSAMAAGDIKMPLRGILCELLRR